MTENSLKTAGKPARLDNPYKDKPPGKSELVRVKCVRAEGFYEGSAGLIPLGGEVDCSKPRAKELIECGYAALIADPAPPTPVQAAVAAVNVAPVSAAVPTTTAEAPKAGVAAPAEPVK